ncbi:4019_t:CDS:2, partial [Funneliformis geosporum]
DKEPDRELARKWESRRSHSRIHISGTVNGTTINNGIVDTINGFVAGSSTRDFPDLQTKRDPSAKRTKFINDYFAVQDQQPRTPPPWNQEVNDQEGLHLPSKHTSNDDDGLLDEEPNKSSDPRPEEDGEFDEGKFLKELITVEEVINPIVEKLLKYGEGIARYKIIFLPEDNKQDPVKIILTSQEWVTSEHDWQMVEAKITSFFSVVIPENIKSLN